MHKKFFIILGATAMLATTPAAVAQLPRGDEPVAVPRTIKQGIDFVYVDPQMSTVARRKQRPQNWLSRILNPAASRRGAPNPMFDQLAQGLQQYQASWGRLPQTKIPVGAALKRGTTGKRVCLLRTRLGLSPAGGYDDQLAGAVSAYQAVHGLGTPDGIAGKATIASLNRGSLYYARRIAINMERAYRLPAVRAFDRYVVVDSGGAEAYYFNRDRMADKMKVVVGTTKTKTPMMAVLMRNARVDPYWNVPPELVRSLTAKKVGEQGLSYFRDFHYEVLSDWGPNARIIDPKTVNWKGIASGKVKPTVHVRQLPGPWNSMRNMKFEMPNDFGIYLHDTPHDELFAQNERHLSNGCVRLEDYKRFAGWVFGYVPQSQNGLEAKVDLPRPVPVYMTYLTVAASPNGVTFRPDPYGFDALAMPQMFGGTTRIASDQELGIGLGTD
jgi:murein L,D-transpeptidase YcbB/YkuD